LAIGYRFRVSLRQAARWRLAVLRGAAWQYSCGHSSLQANGWKLRLQGEGASLVSTFGRLLVSHFRHGALTAIYRNLRSRFWHPLTATGTHQRGRTVTKRRPGVRMNATFFGFRRFRPCIH
jgi:hypothetical protein